MSNDVLSRVQTLVAERFGIDSSEVTPTASFKEDLGADSLETVELIMELEDEFDVEVPDEVAETLVTVGDVVKYISEKQ